MAQARYVALIEDAQSVDLLVDYGDADPLSDRAAPPELLQAACEKAKIPSPCAGSPAYDHSY
jgi:S-formylglutathione hydrolase